jgi:hypothetical protein
MLTASLDSEQNRSRVLLCRNPMSTTNINLRIMLQVSDMFL